jgi:hypothetical protein
MEIIPRQGGGGNGMWRVLMPSTVSKAGSNLPLFFGRAVSELCFES